MKLFKHLFAMACLLFVCLPAMADNKLSVEPVNIDNNEVFNIPVVMTNSDPVIALQFDFTLPDFMESAGDPIATDRFNGQDMEFNGTRVLIYTFEQEPFHGNDGAVVLLPVKVKEGTAANTTGEIKFSKITLTGSGATTVGSDKEGFTVNVTYKEGGEEKPTLTFTTTPAEIVLNPGETKTFEINFSTVGTIYDIQMNFNVPEGLKLTNIAKGSGLPNGATLSFNKNTNILIYANLRQNALPAEGVFCTVTVTADADYSAPTSQITTSFIEASYTVTGATIECPNFGITVTNTVNLYNTLTAAANSLDTKLADTLAEIAQSCPDVKDQFTGDAITAEINSLKEAIANAHANGTLAAQEQELNSTIAAISAKIDQLKADAEQAESDFKAAQANEEAYNRLMSQVGVAQQSLADTLEAIKEDCPDVADQFTGEAIQAKINAIKTKIEEAKAAGTCVANEEAINAEIAALATDLEALHQEAVEAEEAYKAAQAAAANEAAYNDLMAQLNVAQQSLADTLESIKEDCPDVADQFNGDAIQAKIDAIKAKIEAAKEAGTCVDQKDDLMAEIAALGADIEKLMADAVAAEEQFKADRAANEAAYNELLEQLGVAQQSLANTLQSIQEDCPDVAKDFTGEAIQAKIDALKVKIEAAKTAGTCVDQKDALMAEIAALGTDIEKLMADAVAAEEQFKADRAAYENQAAYNRLMNQVGVAQQSLDDTLDAIKEDCPDVADQFTGDAIQAKIDEIKTKIEDAKTAGTCVAEEEELMAEIVALATDLEKLMADAVAAEETYRSEQRDAANKAAYERLTAKLAAERDSLAAELAKIAETCPDVKDDFTGKEISDKLDELANEIESLYEQGLCGDEEENLNARLDEIASEIDEYLDEASAAQAKFELIQANTAAFDEVIAQIDSLQTNLDAMIAHIAETYPGVPVTPYINTAQSAIDNARQGAHDALATANDEGTEFDYTFDADAIQALIDEIEKAAQMLGISDIFGDSVEADAFCDVYTTDGRLIRKQIPVTEVKNQLARGIYIVVVNGTTYKFTL